MISESLSEALNDWLMAARTVADAYRQLAAIAPASAVLILPRIAPHFKKLEAGRIDGMPDELEKEARAHVVLLAEVLEEIEAILDDRQKEWN